MAFASGSIRSCQFDLCSPENTLIFCVISPDGGGASVLIPTKNIELSKMKDDNNILMVIQFDKSIIM